MAADDRSRNAVVGGREGCDLPGYILGHLFNPSLREDRRSGNKIRDGLLQVRLMDDDPFP